MLVFKKIQPSNLVKTQLSSSDVKLYKNNNIKISVEAQEFLGFDENKRIYIDKFKGQNGFRIASIPAQFDEEGVEIAIGKKLNSNGSFSNRTLNTIMGGELSEYDINKDDFILDGGETEDECFKFYSLVEKVNGKEKREELIKKDEIENGKENETIEDEDTETKTVEDETDEIENNDVDDVDDIDETEEYNY